MTTMTALQRLPGALAALGLVAAICASGCGASQQQAAATTNAEPLPESATCPVMKNTFKPDASTTRTTYKGKTYYFCCPGCDKKFAADPESYLGGDEAPAAEGAATP